MSNSLELRVDGWTDGASIPAKFAFGRLDAKGEFELSENTNPAIAWSGAPSQTKSFALIVHDRDVPSSGEDVNQKGKTVPADLPRVNFYHWVLANIPASVSAIAEGAASQGVTARGKAVGKREYGVAGQNSYTGWFAGDADMAGTYGGYDGPCPPWNDSIIHHYHFTVYALGVEELALEEGFDGPALEKAIEGHVLAKAEHVGTYTLNAELL